MSSFSNLPPAAASQVFESFHDTRTSSLVALTHHHRLRGRLLRVTRIEGRRWVVLDRALNRLGDLGPSNFGRDTEADVELGDDIWLHGELLADLAQRR